MVTIIYLQLVPDPESNRCKVVIGSCELEKPYKVYVVAIPEGQYLLCYHDNTITWVSRSQWYLGHSC